MNDGYVNITSITSTIIAVGTVVTHLGVSSLTGTTADEAWREEAWSAAHGYPRTITQHQNRLIFGGTRDLPQSVLASVSSDYLDFDTSDTADDYSYTKEIGTQEVNTIRSIVGRQDLHIFTNTEEFVIDGTDAITATAGRIVPQNSNGIATIRPVMVNSDIIYLTQDGKGVHIMRYNADQAQYVTSNLTTLSQSIINSPVSLAYLNNYDDTQSNLIFIVNGDGTMSVLSLDTDKEVYGWSTFSTEGDVISACTVDDTLYVLVERSGVACLEKLTTDEIYLDSWYRGTDVTGKTSWTGATTLAGETVGVMASENDTDLDTYYVHDDVTIGSSGEFTTNEALKAVAVGHRYTCTLQTLPIAFGSNGQLIRGTNMRVVRVEIRVRKTKQFTVEGYQVSERVIGDSILDANLPNIDKIIGIGVNTKGNNPTLTVQSSDPNPLRILGLTGEVLFRGAV